jgi:hypothetical protein
MAKNTYSRFKITVSTWKKSAASRPEAWARRNSRQAGLLPGVEDPMSEAL